VTDLFGETLGEAPLRMAWRALVDDRLPAAAPGRGWPIHLNHCFARVLLDAACGCPWREVIKPPAWRNAPEPVLIEAIELGEAVLAGSADLHVLNVQSLTLRGKRPR